MKKIFMAMAALAVISGVCTSCKDDYPHYGNALDGYPITALIVTVNGIDYTAVPSVTDGKVADGLYFDVLVPGATGSVKELYLSPDATCDVNPGQTVTFVDDAFIINVTQGGATKPYQVKMVYEVPPVMYLTKTSNYDPDGNRYYLDPVTAQRIASKSGNGQYEGYIDLTETNWDNIGLVSEDLLSYYDYDGGWSPAVSYGTFTLKANSASEGEKYFKTLGPWGNWLFTNGNPQILSPGVWKFNYDSESGVLTMLETQWAISGSAVSSPVAMTYSSSDKKWTVTTSLAVGTLKFTTIAVTDGDPTVNYGDMGSSAVTGYLSATGMDIPVTESGTYTVELNLSNPPYYSYSIR